MAEYEVAFTSQRTEDEVDELANRADDMVNDGENPFPGKTYVEGIADVLLWLNNPSAECPLD